MMQNQDAIEQMLGMSFGAMTSTNLLNNNVFASLNTNNNQSITSTNLLSNNVFDTPRNNISNKTKNVNLKKNN